MYRQGAVGALLDIYDKAITDLKNAIKNIPDDALPKIIDSITTDENCRSLQSILTHVVHSGFGYATSIHNLKGEPIQRPGKVFHLTIMEYIADLEKVFSYTEKIFSTIKDDDLEQMEETKKIKTGWGQLYDIEQLTEHAIVHILRHTRQIEKIRSKI
jgi:uncharacterized damage-inducible protein DinB